MTIDASKFRDVLTKVASKPITVINPESYKATRLGFKLDTQFYRASIKEVKDDYVIMVCDFSKDPKTEDRIGVTQYIPMERIKRISVLPDEIFMHL